MNVATDNHELTDSVNGRKLAMAAAGVVLVALGAQVAVPIPGSPVPLTMQVPAVLIVGGLLGARMGALTLVMYLGIGAIGAPVFAVGGIPGAARLFGPTGGYLLAYPLAAAVIGLASSKPGMGWLAGGLVGGLAVIHLGGISQLAILTGDFNLAFNMGSLPFIIGDAAKLLFAGLVIARLGQKTKSFIAKN